MTAARPKRTKKLIWLNGKNERGTVLQLRAADRLKK